MSSTSLEQFLLSSPSGVIGLIRLHNPSIFNALENHHLPAYLKRHNRTSDLYLRLVMSTPQKRLCSEEMHSVPSSKIMKLSAVLLTMISSCLLQVDAIASPLSRLTESRHYIEVKQIKHYRFQIRTFDQLVSHLCLPLHSFSPSYSYLTDRSLS